MLPLTDRPTPRSPSARTYVVLAVDDGATTRLTPLGTVAAASRGAAQALARVAFAEVGPARLRVLAAGSTSADLLARALVRDGEGMLRAG
jgi:hypothetical protein